jgi:DNA cross-link repair 1A protein
MFVFILPDGSRILHTGDFRANASVIASATPFGPIDHLFIDCTFAIAGLSIPPRELCRDFVIERCRALMPQGYSVILGTYTIGKEDLILDVADGLGCTAYAPEERLKGIKNLMAAGWRKSSLLVDDGRSARIHIVPIKMTSIEMAIEYAVRVGWSKIVAFQMTGWSGKPSWRSPRTMTARGVDAIGFAVPYSDHSSPEELIRFVQAVNPARITSTTQSSDKEVRQVQKFFMPYIRKDRNRGFIEFYGSAPEAGPAPAVADDSQCFRASQRQFLSDHESDG